MAEATASTDYKKPLPYLEDPQYAPFWQAAKEHRLVMQRCTACRHIRWPVNPFCTECLSPDVEWAELSGRGELFTWNRFFQGYHPEWAKETPYNVSLVKLEEGPIMLTNMVDVAHEDLRAGMPVEITFDDVTPEVSIPKFRPRS